MIIMLTMTRMMLMMMLLMTMIMKNFSLAILIIDFLLFFTIDKYHKLMLQYITRAKERRTITQMVKSKICAVTKVAKKSL